VRELLEAAGVVQVSKESLELLVAKCTLSRLLPASGAIQQLDRAVDHDRPLNPKLEQLSEETSRSLCHHPRTTGDDLVEQLDHFAGSDGAGIAAFPVRQDVMLEDSLHVCRVSPVGFEKLDAVWTRRPTCTEGGVVLGDRAQREAQSRRATSGPKSPVVPSVVPFRPN